MRRSLQRGEIATVIAIGTLIIIGVASLFSSAFLGQKQTTKSKAQETCKEEFFCIDKTCMKRFTNCGQDFAKGQCAGLPCGPQQTNTSPAPIISLGAGAGGVTGSCTDDYREACTCAGGQSGTKACRKVGGPGTEGKTGADCPWGAGSSCGSCECSGGGGGATSPAPSKPPDTGLGGGGDCAWGDWTCASAGGNNDAGRICGKMGKSLCAPGDGRSDGAGKVCQKNQWDDKWGCWGPGLSTQTSTPYGYCNLAEGSCSQRSQQDPKEHYQKWFKCSSGEWKGPFDSENTCKGGTSTNGGTNCTPGEGGPGPGGKYYCCYKADEGPEGGKKLPFPHYEDEGKTKVDCAVKTGVGSPVKEEKPPSGCGLKSYKLSVDRKYICGQGSEDEKFSYENGWCCEPILGPQASSDNCKSSSFITCDNETKINYYTGSKNGKIIGYYKEKKDCTAEKVPDAPSTATTDAAKKNLWCSSATTRNCTDDDYTILVDQDCGAKNWCGPKQKKYRMTAGVKCTPASQVNSEFKCKNDLLCGALSSGELTIPCNPVQCESGRTDVYQKGNGYYFNKICDGLSVTIDKAIACGPSTKNLSCLSVTKLGCWFTTCDSTSALMKTSYTCKQDLSGLSYCCPPGKSPPNSGGVTSAVPTDVTSTTQQVTDDNGQKVNVINIPEIGDVVF